MRLILSVFAIIATAGRGTTEPFHIYNHDHWLIHPEPNTTAIYFDNAKFSADAACDRSLHVVTPAHEAASDDALQAFRTSLRRHGVTLGGLPVAGTWYVAQGGDTFHLRENGFGDFALDLVRLDDAGHDHRGDGKRNADYYAFDQPVVAPVDGEIWLVDRDQPDGDPTKWTYGSGNAVYLRVAGRYEVAFLHLRAGSIPASIKPGVRVKRGTMLGRVGNSGTQPPHLHLSLLWLDPVTGRSWGVPFEFAQLSRKTVNDDKARASTWVTPMRGDLISNDELHACHQPRDGWAALGH
jgi:hypothetical protein